jgi:transaldolase
MPNKLDQLKQLTTVVADTGDIEAIETFKPVDATTNPSLLLKAAQMPQYKSLLTDAKAWATQQGGSSAEQLSRASQRLGVEIGTQILTLVPGRISTEVDARLSFDTAATLDSAHRLVDQYNEKGINNDRLLIKIAATWEGVRAAQILEKEGINCNLTLLFGFAQAAACADAGVYLISPFVGRIFDWYVANSGQTQFSAEQDPGVLSVKHIFDYYKQHNYNTIVMGASFRNTEQIEALAGCDRLTISPQLLQQLQEDNGELTRKLDSTKPSSVIDSVNYDQNAFRWSLNEDAMATEKLAEGIRNFAADQIKLEAMLAQL